jgi:hypothetical protein
MLYYFNQYQYKKQAYATLVRLQRQELFFTIFDWNQLSWLIEKEKSLKIPYLSGN